MPAHVGQPQILDAFLKTGDISLLHEGNVPIKGEESGHGGGCGNAGNIDRQHGVTVAMKTVVPPVEDLAPGEVGRVRRKGMPPEQASRVGRSAER